MNPELLAPDLTGLDWQVADRDEFFARMDTQLRAGGYVADTFLDAILAREALYPTALPTQPEAIAIPHRDAIHVHRPFIAVTRLAAPVPWHEMANNDATHLVRFVFTLGLTHDDGHVAVLAELVEHFQDRAFLQGLRGATSADELFAVVARAAGAPRAER